MGLFDDGYANAIADANVLPVAQPPAGFMDAFRASFQSTRQEGLSISERQNYLDKVKIRNETIEKLTGARPSVSIDAGDLLRPGRLSTTVELARQAYDKQVAELSARFPEVKTDPDIHREIIEDSRRIREKSDSVLSNTSFTGKLGSFTGVMAATMGDPLVLASIPFGASSSATILRTALTEAGINMASEAAIQPFVYRYKKSLGSPYSVGEAATSIAAAGAGGAVLGGGLKAIARGIDRLRSRPRLDGIDDLLEAFDRHLVEPTALQRDAAHVLGDYADIVRENPFQMGTDTTTLYRVESEKGARGFVKRWTEGGPPPAEVQGRWFTDDPALSDFFIKKSGPDANVYAVRVPTKELDRFRASNLPEAREFATFPEQEYFLPRELANTKAAVTRPDLTQPEADLIHLRATARAIADLDAGRPVDVQDIVGELGPQVYPKTIAGTAERTPATVDQSLSQFVKNSGGVSIDKAGALRGEYDALFENGGRTSGAVKRKAGKSPDELAQLAHEAGFIDEPDPALLAEKLRQDVSGDKVRSLQSETFDRRLDLQIDREFKQWAEMAEKEYNAVADELAAKAKQILDTDDVMVARADGPRSARELLNELDHDVGAAKILQKCLLGVSE